MGARILHMEVAGHTSLSPGPSLLEERAKLLSASQLCTGLEPAEILQVASCARPKAFARDETLFHQGQPVHCLFLIRTGTVKITQISSSGSEVILWMYGKGNAVGVLSESSADCHPSSARAMEPTTALVWDSMTIQKLSNQYPRIRQNLSQVLMSRLNELEERFREVATEKVAKRVALALLRLVKQVGKHAAGGVEVSLSREELAQMTGTTLFTISRLLSRWGEEGFVLPRREAVVVRDPKRLGQVSDE